MTRQEINDFLASGGSIKDIDNLLISGARIRQPTAIGPSRASNYWAEADFGWSKVYTQDEDEAWRVSGRMRRRNPGEGLDDDE